MGTEKNIPENIPAEFWRQAMFDGSRDADYGAMSIRQQIEWVEARARAAYALTGAKPKGRTLQTFDQWIASLNGADAIPQDCAAFKFADAAKIPREFVYLLWRKFESTYTGEGKKYRDWLKVFRKAVEGCWFDLYRINRAGEYYLTTAGQAFQRSIGAQS